MSLRIKILASGLVICFVAVGLVLPSLFRTELALAKSDSCQLTWREIPFGLNVEGGLQGVAAFSDADVWTVGYTNGAAIFHWNGKA